MQRYLFSTYVTSFSAYHFPVADIALKFHPKHVTNKNKTKQIMKISHINESIYDRAATSQQNSDKDAE